MKTLFPLLFLCLSISVFGQNITQSVRGIVTDQDSKIPLIGATVQVEESLNGGTTTDVEGNFILDDIPVGRITLVINYIGYNPVILPNLVLSSGKELVLNVEMTESIVALEEIVVTAKTDKQKPLNEMATVSARSFSVEETQRYAASLLDPARMAQNYAGVTSSGDDLSNEIVIRGNSPNYVQWRIEGIQVPGPNHYASKGSSGGGISMLSSSMLADSDFYTGAFPADIGNALAGAFDLNFRNGNNQRREHSFQAGVIGIEASTEGPFSKNSNASYLINYRYSALGIIQKITDLDFGDAQIDFQDISFKVNIPTKKVGTFSFFGLGGLSNASSELVQDSTEWRSNNDLFENVEQNAYGLLGLKHRYLFKDNKTYIKTIIAGTYDRYKFDESFVDRRMDNALIDDERINLEDEVLRSSMTLNHKASAKHNFRAGVVHSYLRYNFLNSNRILSSSGNFEFDYGPAEITIEDSGSTQMLQSFIMHKYRPSNSITINYGIHHTYFALSKSSAIEPRFGLRYNLNEKQSLAVSAGLHSQAEHLINYTLRRQRPDGSLYQPNLDLPLTKAAHFVLGYDHSFSNSTRIKVETYYQRLFDVPMDTSFVAGSILNAEDVYDVLYQSNTLVGEGKGQNIGIDLTLERFLNDGLYYLVTGSFFDSSITGTDGNKFNTRYNSRFNLTFLGGKEYALGKSRKNLLGINTKILYYGGNRYTEYDFNTGFFTPDGFYKLQADPYFRIDASINYRINKNNSTHILTFELQNVTNRKNVESVLPDFGSNTYFTTNQAGLIPNLNYRIEF